MLNYLNRHWISWSFLLGILLPGLVPAVGWAGDRITPADVARLQYVTSAKVAPDGVHIAYTRAVPRDPMEEQNGSAWTELHVVTSSGKDTPFITGQVNVSDVQWLPDGRRIAYTAKRGDDKHRKLYAIAVDGGESRVLLEHAADVRGASFSADGSWVAFLSTDPKSDDEQALIDKGFNQEIYEEDWRPTQVWLAPLDGSQEPRALELPRSASTVRWSPVSRQLLVVTTPTPLVDDSYMAKQVIVVDADNGQVLERFHRRGKLGQVAWSPDGAHVVMIAGEDVHDPKEGRLMVADVPGDGSVRNLMPDYMGHVHQVEWRDAQTMVVLADQGTESGIAAVNLDGSVSWQTNELPAAVNSFSLSERTIAAVAHSSTHPAEVFALVEESPAKRLTTSNAWLTEKRMARQERVRWAARDGLELEGILVYPLDYQPVRKYPLIMTVHGGPEAHVLHGWVTSYSYAGQVGAARGFFVFYPNYRGSTGRGVEFSKLGQADAAGKEFDDLVDGVDHLVAEGLVDPEKVGITGGSYGGYASAWGATYYSERFAASVMFVGISDNVSKVGTTDIPEEMYLVHHLKRLWEDWDYFLDRSPIRHVEKNRTPTLIMHGKSDPRVHPSQSMELFRHLKTLNQAPVRLVFYPGEGHGNRLAAARLDYHLRLLQWMEHYLQGSGEGIPAYRLDYEKLMNR